MVKTIFTYYDPVTDTYSNSQFHRHTASMAANSIFRRILREANDRETVSIKLKIKNIDENHPTNFNKLYYYKCVAVYNPREKLISEKHNKTILIKYDINIIKLNSETF